VLIAPIISVCSIISTQGNTESGIHRCPNAVDTQAGESDMPGDAGLVKGSNSGFTEEADLSGIE
jgi:hypothetical protein